MGTGVFLTIIFLTGWDATRTIQGFYVLWQYLEIPTYTFLGFLAITFTGLISKVIFEPSSFSINMIIEGRADPVIYLFSVLFASFIAFMGVFVVTAVGMGFDSGEMASNIAAVM